MLNMARNYNGKIKAKTKRIKERSEIVCLKERDI